MFTPIESKKKYMLVVEQIKGLIEEGKLKNGEKLPSERELSNQFELSRATIREALSALEILGLVQVRTGLGTYVCNNQDNKNIIDIEQELDTRTSPTEILEARIIVEPELSRLAALRATAEDLKNMEEIINRADSLEEKEIEIFEELDKDFHLLIAKSTYNETLYAFAASINSERIGRLWGNLKFNSLQTKGRMNKYKEEHKMIYNAILHRNSNLAEELTRKHLLDIRHDLFED